MVLQYSVAHLQSLSSSLHQLSSQIDRSARLTEYTTNDLAVPIAVAAVHEFNQGRRRSHQRLAEALEALGTQAADSADRYLCADSDLARPIKFAIPL